MNVKLIAKIRAYNKAAMPKTSFEQIFSGTVNEEINLGYKDAITGNEVYAIRKQLPITLDENSEFSLKILEYTNILYSSYSIKVGEQTYFTASAPSDFYSYIVSNGDNELFLEGEILGHTGEDISATILLIYTK